METETPPVKLDPDLQAIWDALDQQLAEERNVLVKTGTAWSPLLDALIDVQLALLVKQMDREAKRMIYWIVGLTLVVAAALVMGIMAFGK